MAKKPKKGPSRETFAKGALRRASLMWKPISECRRLARVERGLYLCAICKGHFPAKQTQVDHRESVISVTEGWQGWDTYIERLFCDVENLDLLCKNCHEAKTTMEVQMRAFSRKKRKEEETEDEEI